jgi:cell division initiation protein
MARLTPLDIRKMEFKQSALGFGREQVSRYLESVADEMEELIRENNELRKEAGRLQEKLGSYRNIEQSMNEALVLAKDSAKKAVLAAQKEAETIIQKGTIEKDALLFSAKEELNAMQRDIQSLRSRRDGMLIKLRSVLRNHLEVLELEFDEDEPEIAERPLIQEADGEKIIDFSQADVSVGDIQDENEDDEPEDENQEPHIEGELEDFGEDDTEEK